MADASHEAWVRVGEMLQDRRFELDRRYAAPKGLDLFAEEHGINKRLAWEVETAYRSNFRPGTRLLIEDAYELVPGSIRRALAGGELTPADRTPAAPPDGAPPLVRENWGYRAVRVVWETPLEEEVRLAMVADFMKRQGEAASDGRRRSGYRAS